MENETSFVIVGICAFVILLVSTLTAIHNNKEIPLSSNLYGNVLIIKRNCSENALHIILKALSDDKLTYGEYDEIVSIYNEEYNRKILAELSK
jgi:hypothetical protein